MDGSKGIRGVIFDLDGTLLDSRLDFDRMRDDLGFPSGPILEQIDALDCPQQQQRAMEIVHRHEIRGAELATWMPGAEAMLAQLRSKSVPTGIVTRNSRPVMNHVLETLPLQVDATVTRDESLPKPHPDGLLQLADLWSIEPMELVYVGDYRFDLEAAAAAGMASVLYRNADNAKFAEQATWVVEHFDQLLDVLGLD